MIVATNTPYLRVHPIAARDVTTTQSLLQLPANRRTMSRAMTIVMIATLKSVGQGHVWITWRLPVPVIVVIMAVKHQVKPALTYRPTIAVMNAIGPLPGLLRVSIIAVLRAVASAVTMVRLQGVSHQIISPAVIYATIAIKPLPGFLPVLIIIMLLVVVSPAITALVPEASRLIILPVIISVKTAIARPAGPRPISITVQLQAAALAATMVPLPQVNPQAMYRVLTLVKTVTAPVPGHLQPVLITAVSRLVLA